MPHNFRVSPILSKSPVAVAKPALEAFLSRLMFKRREQLDDEPEFERLDVTDGLHRTVSNTPQRLPH